MASVYLAPEVDSVVQKIRKPALKSLVITSVFEDKKSSRWAGKITKTSKIVKLLTDVDLVVHVWSDAWNSLNDDGKEALAAHELEHVDYYMGKDGKMHIKLLPHDVEEFNAVIEKYGLWTASLVRMNDVIEKVIREKEEGEEDE